ncbi:MAG: exosortase-associated EpsI family protein, partial [Pontiellaceae bacterium]|nr:exosortase-associated EpsI family protein [Pontiellaceae bacterium]
MEKSLIKPFLIVVGLMSVTALALAFTCDVKLNFTPGVKMELPEVLDGWVGNELRFCHNPDLCAKNYQDASFYVRDLEDPNRCPDCGYELFSMTRSEYEALPKDTEFIKSAYTNNVGRRVYVSIVLSGTERDSIHRPQRCLVAQGNALDKEYTMDIPLKGRDPLQVRVIKASKAMEGPDGTTIGRNIYYAYWFVGQDRETPSHVNRMFWLAWDRVVHSKASRWAYISVSGECEPKGKAYEAEIKDIVQKLYPTLLTESMRNKVYGE